MSTALHSPAFDRGHGGDAVGRFRDGEAAALERAPHEQARARIVVDDEYVDGCRRRSLARQATLAELSSASSSDSATVRCARSLVIEDGSSVMSPLRAECLDLPRDRGDVGRAEVGARALERVRGARDGLGIADLHAVVHVGEQLRGVVAIERDQPRQQAVLAVRIELAHGFDRRSDPASPCWPPSATPSTAAGCCAAARA